jgi:hypothetical protein
VADIDELLKGSFERLAEPADSAGVADAIRSRVAAGDAGTSVAGGTAPGWIPPRPRWFWPLVATVAGLAAVVAVLFAVLLWPAPAEPLPTADPSPVATETATPTPSPTPTPAQAPTEDPEHDTPQPPPPPRDTTAPKISAGQWSNAEVWPTGYNCTPTSSDILVTATDEAGLASVTAATSAAGTSAAFIGNSGSGYTFRFSGAPGGSGDIQVIVTFTAVDDAGNTASISRPILFHQECIIIG